METVGCCFPLTALLHQKNQSRLRQRIQKTNRTDHQHSNRGLGKPGQNPPRDRASGCARCFPVFDAPIFWVWLRGISTEKELLWQKN